MGESGSPPSRRRAAAAAASLRTASALPSPDMAMPRSPCAMLMALSSAGRTSAPSHASSLLTPWLSGRASSRMQRQAAAVTGLGGLPYGHPLACRPSRSASSAQSAPAAPASAWTGRCSSGSSSSSAAHERALGSARNRRISAVEAAHGRLTSRQSVPRKSSVRLSGPQHAQRVRAPDFHLNWSGTGAASAGSATARVSTSAKVSSRGRKTTQSTSRTRHRGGRWVLKFCQKIHHRCIL